mgnify:CR=1 FL=1
MSKKQSQNSKIDQISQLQKDLAKKFKGKTLVFGEGKPSSSVMIVGDATNGEEEGKSKLLIGTIGKVFDQLLKEHKLKRNAFYITNAVKFRPLNPVPTPKEIKQSSVFLKQEIKIIEPKLIIALGSIALRGLGVKLPLANLRGRLIRFGDMNLFATHHPLEVVKNPDLHIEISSDFHKLKNIVENLSVIIPS